MCPQVERLTVFACVFVDVLSKDIIIISQVLILHKLFFVLFWSVLKLQIKLVNTVNTTIVSHVYFLLSCYQSLIHPLKVNSDKQTDTNNHPCFSPEHSLQQQYRWSSADYMNLHFKVTNINTLQNLFWYVSCSIVITYKFKILIWIGFFCNIFS